MKTMKPLDLLTDLPLEITLSILEQLEWRETLPLRRLDKQWLQFIDQYFVRADFCSSQFWDKGQFQLQEASRYTRNLCIDGRYLSGSNDWTSLAGQCPRISVLHVSFDQVKTKSFLSFVSNLCKFRFLAILTVENTRYRQIHELLPVLGRSCPALQDLRIHITPANYERMHDYSWLSQERVIHDMPRLRSLDLEFVLMYECYDCHCCCYRAVEVNFELHRPIIQLIAAASGLEILKIGVTYHKNSGSTLEAYAPCIALLHKTHPQLRKAVFERLRLSSTPALAAESLTLIECQELVNPGRAAWLAYRPTAEELWNSKLTYFKQVGGYLKVPLTKNLREIDISEGWTVARFVKQLRESSSDPDLALTSMRSLRLSGSHAKGIRRFYHPNPDDLKYTDLKHLVRIFPNLRKLTLLDQIDVGIIETEIDISADEDESSDEDKQSIEYLGPKIPWTPRFPDERYERERYPHLRDLNDLNREPEQERWRRIRKKEKKRQGFERADPEAYLRANLPKLKRLTIK